MKHKMSKLLSVLLCCVMLLTLLPVTAAAVDGDALTPSWTFSGSKTATNLDSNFESQVTLSLPSAEEPLVTDVVFVLDKSTSSDVKDAAVEMLGSLNEQVKATSAKVKVGVVIFNEKDNLVLNLTELNDENMSKIEEAINYKISSGTNTHAGLLAGKAMLDADTDVDASRKYLIFVSDGITYIFDDEAGTATSIVTENFYYETGEIVSSPSMAMEGAMFKYHYSTNIFGNKTVPEYLAQVKSWMDKDGTTYWVEYGSSPEAAEKKLASQTNANGYSDLTNEEYKDKADDNDTWDHANNLDTALYLTDKVYKDAVTAGYHCYAINKSNETNNDNYPWASIFMNYLADGETVNFEDIKNDILYYVGPNSTVTDVMGYVEGDYNFDFVADAAKLTMTVGGEPLKTQKISENSYGFGESDNQGNYPYVLTYSPANDGTEKFEWKMNVPVTINERVTLTYSVKLTNPKTAAGTYGQYDRDGSQGYSSSGLYTNNSAVLKPVDSEGRTGRDYFFPKPTVSYTVASSRPTTKPSTTKPISSPKTFDAGIALYAGMALLSLTGGAWVVNKKRNGK